MLDLKVGGDLLRELDGAAPDLLFGDEHGGDIT
jgi:hypothetical protein